MLLPSCKEKRRGGLYDFQDKIGRKRLIASIVNPPNYSNDSVAFSMEKADSITVEGVGETLFDLSAETRPRYLKSDDINIVLANRNKDSVFYNYKVFNFSMANNNKALKNEGINIRWETKTGYYYMEVAIPWTKIFISGLPDTRSIGLDVSVGDNDDNYFQKTVISWGGSDVDNNIRKPKACLLKDSGSSSDNMIAVSSPHIDGSVGDWRKMYKNVINNVIYGYVKDSLDLSSFYKCAWNKDSIYFLVYVQDQKLRRIFYDHNTAEKEIFVDYGWIANSAGDTVWRMEAFRCKYAGGSYRNQMVDTSLFLKKGKYFLHYRTDEAHSYGNWVGAPPQTAFYGIRCYK